MNEHAECQSRWITDKRGTRYCEQTIDSDTVNEGRVARCGRALVLLAALVGVVPGGLAAQRPVSEAVRDAGLERYFRDSLNANTQRILKGVNLEMATTATVLTPRDAVITSVGTEAVRKAPVSPGGEVQWVLPERVFGADSGGEPFFLRTVVVNERGGLNYDFQRALFAGTMRVGFEDSLSTESKPVPVGLRDVLLTGVVDSVVPSDIQIGHSNLPYRQVSVFARSPAVDSVRMEVRTNRSTVEIFVPIVRADLGLDASPLEVQGFGLESTELVVGPEPGAGGIPIRLTTDRGNLSTTSLQLDDTGAAQATLRSSWIGSATVELTSAVFADEHVQVVFVFPWLFLGAALLGGLVGGTAGSLTKDRKLAWASLVAGALIGLVVAAAYAVGINLLDVEPSVTTGQAVVFVFAALGGFAGAPVLGLIPKLTSSNA